MVLLSIIIPFYNAEKTIGRALDSLNSLSRESKEVIEVIVIDDGSNDLSNEIVESKKKGLAPLEVVLITQENTGTAGARNVGIEQSKGEWVFFLDSDDELVFDPILFIHAHPDCSALGFAVQLFKRDQACEFIRPILITSQTHLDIFTAANAFQPSNLIIKKRNIATLFDTSFKYIEDWFFWLENSTVFEHMHIFPDTVSARINIHGQNKSSHYAKVGLYRVKMAEEILEQFSDRLTRVQKNNLLIQRHIGALLQGKKTGANIFFHLPCNPLLYAKLIIYSILKQNFSKFDIYGS